MATDDETVLVYDLGGGTFDCAVSTPTHSAQRSIRLTGSRPFGGRDFDYKVLEEVGRRFPAEVNAVIGDGASDGEPWRRLHLLESCESLKVRLSDTDPVSEPLTELGPNVDMQVPGPSSRT